MKYLGFTIVILVAVILLIPLTWMISGAFQPGTGLMKVPPAVITNDMTLKNFTMAQITKAFERSENDIEDFVYERIDKICERWGIAVTNFWITKFAPAKVYIIIGNEMPVIDEDE